MSRERASRSRRIGSAVMGGILALLGITSTPAHATATPASTRTVQAPATPQADAGTTQTAAIPWDDDGVTDNGWFQIGNNGNGQCMRTTGYAPDTEVRMYSNCHARMSMAPLNELWTMVWATDPDADGGWYWLRNLDTGMCLTAPSWAGYNLIQTPCSYFTDQEWKFTWSATRTQLRLRATGSCLVAPSWAPNDVVLAACADFADQYWNRLFEPDAEVDNEVFPGMAWTKVQFRRSSHCTVEYRYLLSNLFWTDWESREGDSLCTRHRITAVRTVNRTIQFFIRSYPDNAVYTTWRDQDWSSTSHPWVPLGGVTYSPVAVGKNADGRLQIFVRGSDGRIHTNWQPVASYFDYWSGWNPIPSASYPNGNYAMSDPIVDHWGTGAETLINVYVDFPNGLTYRRTQESPNCSTPTYPYSCFGDTWIRYTP